MKAVQAQLASRHRSSGTTDLVHDEQRRPLHCLRCCLGTFGYVRQQNLRDRVHCTWSRFNRWPRRETPGGSGHPAASSEASCFGETGPDVAAEVMTEVRTSASSNSSLHIILLLPFCFVRVRNLVVF